MRLDRLFLSSYAKDIGVLDLIFELFSGLLGTALYLTLLVLYRVNKIERAILKLFY